jgi:very-short-patch-repair endonuclease
VWEETAAAQAGILTRRQAGEGGLSEEAIRARLESGRWQRVFPGALATFSGPVPRAAQMWAAVLVSGPAAVLSHETAAELAGLSPEPGQAVHVSVPLARRVRARPGIVVHRSMHAEPHPALRPPRTRLDDTVIDLTQTSPTLDAAAGWLIRAVSTRLTTAHRLLAVIGARARIKWRRELVAVLADVAEGCHSMLELRYLRRVERAHALPRGRRQRRRERWYDDVEYGEFGVSIELDGRAAHPAELAFRDHRRDNAAVLTGSRVLRYGFGDVTHRPCAVAQEVAAVLNAAGWLGRPRGCGPTCLLNQSGNLLGF